MPSGQFKESAETSLWHSEDADINRHRQILWAVNCEWHIHADGTQNYGIRCLCAALRFLCCRPAGGTRSALRQVSYSQFYFVCSGVKGRGKKCQTCTWWTFSFVLSLYLKTHQAILQLLHFSPSIIITLILQDPFKCCLQLSLLNSDHPLSTLAKSVCQPYLNTAFNFPWMFLSFIHSFNMYLLKIYSGPSTSLRTRNMATFKTDKSPCLHS